MRNEDLIYTFGIVTTKGVHFRGIYYSCVLAMREEWFLKAKRGCWIVAIIYQNGNTNYIDVFYKANLIRMHAVYRNDYIVKKKGLIVKYFNRLSQLL